MNSISQKIYLVCDVCCVCVSVAGTGVEQRLLPPPAASAASLSLTDTQLAADRPTTLPVGTNSEAAPPPPPRNKQHSRSSSLDNKLIDLDEAGKWPVT